MIDIIERTFAWMPQGEDDDRPNLYGRGVVKRNAMTYNYNSRKYGFAEQLRKDWMKKLTRLVRKERQNPGTGLKEHPFGRDKGFAATVFLGEVHEQAISDVVRSAKPGMEFIKECARLLAAEGKHLSFTDTVNAIKSVNASSPNIIHAQDSTLLMNVVVALRTKGITDLMTIHDSFSTTAGNMHVMRRTLLEETRKLYDGYCLFTDLLEQVKDKLDDWTAVELPTVPAKGNEAGVVFDLMEIERSNYAYM